MVGDEDREPCLAQADDDLLNLAHRDGIDAAEGLVQHQQFGIGRQGTGDRQAPLFATAEGECDTPSQARNAEAMHQRVASLAAVTPGHFARFQHGHDVFFDGQFAKNRFFLRQIAHTEIRALVHRHARHLFAGKDDSSRVRHDETDDHVKRGRFAGTIWPQQADDFSRTHGHVHAIDHGPAVVDLSQLLSVEQKLVARAASCPRSRHRRLCVHRFGGRPPAAGGPGSGGRSIVTHGISRRLTIFFHEVN